MRQKSTKPKTRDAKRGTINAEPIAEGVAKKVNRPRGFFATMKDEELVAFVQRYIDEHGFSRPKELENADHGIYSTLHNRKLLSRLVYFNKRKEWVAMGTEDFLSFTQRFVDENRIDNPRELHKADPGMFQSLRRHSLRGTRMIELVSFPLRVFHRPKGSFNSMTEDQLVSSAQGFIDQGDTHNRSKLHGNQKLYRALRKRNLMGRLKFEERKRPAGFFRKMSDDELLALVEKLKNEKKIKTIAELHREDGLLCAELRERRKNNPKLFDGLLIRKKKPNGFFKMMSDHELVEYAKEMIEKNKYARRVDLERSDGSLYNELLSRNLLSQTGLKERIRPWVSMSDDQIVSYTNDLIQKNRILRPVDLQNRFNGLFLALTRRGLHKRLRYEKRKTRWRELTDDQLLSQSLALIDSKGIIKMCDFRKKEKQLFQVLYRRGLLHRLGLEKWGRDWASMSDEKLVLYAKRFIKDKGIESRSQFQRLDNPLYHTLNNRNLLFLVFSDIDRIKGKTLERGLLSGLSKAPDAMEKFGEGK